MLPLMVFVQIKVTFSDDPPVKLKADVGDEGETIVTPEGDPERDHVPVSPDSSAFPARFPAGLPLHLAVWSGPALATGVVFTVTVCSSYAIEPSAQGQERLNL